MPLVVERQDGRAWATVRRCRAARRHASVTRNRHAAPVTTSNARAAIGGAMAVAAALATSELLAGLLPGATSLVAAVGQVIIDNQPAGAKDVAVALFGTNDKLAFEIVIVLVALVIGAGLGILAARRSDIADDRVRGVRRARLPRGAARSWGVARDRGGRDRGVGRCRALGPGLAGAAGTYRGDGRQRHDARLVAPVVHHPGRLHRRRFSRRGHRRSGAPRACGTPRTWAPSPCRRRPSSLRSSIPRRTSRPRSRASRRSWSRTTTSIGSTPRSSTRDPARPTGRSGSTGWSIARRRSPGTSSSGCRCSSST